MGNLSQILSTASAAVDTVNQDVVVTTAAQTALTTAQNQQTADVAAAKTDIQNAQDALTAAAAGLPA